MTRRWTLSTGDWIQTLDGMEPEQFDSVVCDPPYGYGFMGKNWDHGVPGVPFWTSALRVSKPGAHLTAFGGPRTFHRVACAIEDAGYEIRDTLMWLHGQGYPKSRDVSQAIDKEAGAEREVISEHRTGWNGTLGGTAALGGTKEDVRRKTAPATDAAKEWDGWGTALKPGWEPIILARKPFSGTIAENVQRYGTGALNIDACKVTTADADRREASKKTSDTARWPANVIVSHSLWCVEGEPCAADCPVQMLDQQSGILSAGNHPANRAGLGFGSTSKGTAADASEGTDVGGASRFYYCPKPSRAEREMGLQHLEAVRRTDGRQSDIDNPYLRTTSVRNHHPTVKPVALMRWLARLTTPPRGLVLDPCCGSGTTGVACMHEGFRFHGIDDTPEYITIAEGRLSHTTDLRI